jgi:hypothetical protein
MNTFFILLIAAAIIVASIPVLVLVRTLLLLVFQEASLLAVSTICLLPVFGWPVIVLNVVGYVGIRAMCRDQR